VLAGLATKGTVAEQRAAFNALAKLDHPAADAMFVAQLTALAAGKIAPAVQLELLTAAAERAAPDVKALLAARDAALAANPDPLAPYRLALAGGDARAGAKIFSSQPVMACVKCHALNGNGGAAGPDLAGVGAKNSREYLLESVVKPNAHIAPGFDTIVVTLKQGGVQAGTIASETDTALTLNPIEGKPLVIAKADIAKRDTAPSSMPEIYGAILTKAELRDVVEFLAHQRARPPAGATAAVEAAPRALRDIRAELAQRNGAGSDP
jgi:quinoprotein glucose dehydrogenase